MAKKKKGSELIANKLRGVVNTKQPANKTTNLTGRTLIANKLQTSTQRAEQERSARMRQGLSTVVRSSFNNRRLQPSNNSTNTVKKGLYQNLRNALAPVKDTAGYTRSQQSKFLNTDLQRKGLNTPAAQLMAGKTNVGVEQGKALRAGMPSGYLTESWRTKPIFTPENWRVQQRDNLIGTPVTKENAFDLRADVNTIDRSHSQAELDARQRYGYSKDFEDYMRNRVENSGKIDRFDPSNGRMTTPLPPSMNQLAQNQATTYMAGKAIADRMRLSDLKAGALDSASAQEIEDVARNAYGFTPDDELQSKLEAQRSTLGYGTGMAAGQMAQYALTRGALTGLGVVGRGAKATETAAQALQREVAIDQAASLPLNIIDAMKEDNLDGMIKRFGMNQGLDLAFGALMEVPSLAKNKLFKSAQAKNIAAQEAEQAGDTATANAMRQSAKRDLDSIPTEELNKAQEEIRNAGYHAGDLGKAENYFQQASSYRHTGHYGTGTYFGGEEDMFSGSSGYGSRPEWKFDFDGYNLYKPKNYEQGIRVHDSLATIDRRSANGLLNDLQLSKDAETIRRVLDDYEYSNPKERLDELKDIAEKYLSKNDIDRIEDDALSAYNYESARINDENYLENRKSEMKSLSEMLFPEDEIDDAMVLDLIASEETPTLPTLDEFRLNYYSDELRKQLDGDVPFGRTSLAEHIENAQNTVKQLAQDLGKTEDEVLNAIEKAARKVEKEYPNVSQSSGMKDLDSEATLVMKNLGFEGVDVRGIDGLDNTEYGSVIYDLKPESRRQQIREGKQKESVATSNNDAFRSAEKSAAENNLEDFRNQLFKDKQQIAAFKERGIIKPKQIREFWREQKMKGFTSDDIVELPEETAVDILREKFPYDYHQQWFQNENKGVKPHVEEIILSDKELRNAGLNIAYLNHKRTYGAKDMGFQEFLDTPVTFYRGWQSDNKLIDDDVFVSFTTDRKVAEKMAKRDGSIEEITLRPRDTLGSYQTNGEYEFLVPRDTYDNVSKVHKTADEVAAVEKQAEPEYNTTGGIDNGTEQRTRSDAERTVGKVQEQPNGNTDSEISGRRPEERPADNSGNNRRLLLNDKQEKLFNDNNVARTGVRESDSPSFISSITENSNSQKYGACVDIPSEKHLKETGAKLYSTADGTGTVAVTKDGDIIALSKKRGAAEGTTDELLLTAIAKGGKKMDAFGADLANLYSRYGFEPVGRVEFNPAIYADEPEKLAVFKQLAVDGKEGPDVYVFKHNGDDLETVISKNRNGEYKTWSQDNLDKLPVFEDSGSGDDVVYGYDKALEYRDGLLKQQESPKDDIGRDIFDGQPRYKPSGAGRGEKYWNRVVKKYEKHSSDWLLDEKKSIPTKVIKNKMGKEEGLERSKLIDSLVDEKARYRHGTLKEVNGEKVSQAYDTLSHSEKTERIRDELQRTFVEDGTGRKQGMHPKQAADEAVARVENDPDAVKLKLLEATETASKGKFPAKYDNSQEYYADVLAFLNHNDSVMEQLEEQGLKNSSQYKLLKADAVKITNGVMAYRSAEGYGAIQYNMLCRSSGEMRVAVVQKAVDDINLQFEKQLEKAAKKEGRKLTEADKIRIQLTDDAIKKLKSVNPESPLEMSKAMHEISEEIWNQVPASFKEEADAIRMTSMLLNPKTHIRNFIGNAFMIPARIMKDILGAPLEKAATKIKFRGESILNPEDATKAIAFRHSKKDKPYFDAAKQVWEEWKEYVRGDMKYFDNVTPTASRLLGSRPVGGGKVFTAGRENPAAWRKVADKIINFNGRLLEASDALFLKYHFTDSFAQVCKARNLDPTKLTNQQLQEVIAAATGEAQRATFRDVSEAAKLINGLKASKPNDALIKKGVAWGTSTVMPFVNTPINILRRSWDYSPAGLLHGCAEITQGVAKGSSKEVKKGIDRMCSGLTGTGICIVGFLLGRDGGLTAKLSDGSEGYYEQDQGFQEYSVNIGGKDGIQLPFLKLENEDGVSVSLSSFAPLVIPLFTGVEVANWWDDDKELDWSAVGRAVDTFGRIFDPTMDMSVMQGPMGVLKAIQDADDLKTAPIDVGLNIAINHYMQYIPTAFGQAARIADPTRRDLSSTKSSYFDKQLEKAKLKFQSRIPSTPLTDNSLYNVSSTGIQPYKDTWGREQKTLEGHPVKRFFYETVSPSYIREKNITELDEEITRLNKAATQEEKIIPTKFFGNEVSFNGGKISVDRKDMTVYNEFRGKSAYAAASKLIDTDGYKNASDSEKRKMLDEVFKEANTEGKQNMLLSKGYSAKKVYTDGFEGGKLENADNVFNAGVKPKDYYKLMTDKSVDLDGNGSKSQYEVYTYLQNSDLTDAQKAAIWNSYNKSWKNNPYAGGTIPTADGGKSGSGGKSGRSGRSGRSGGGSGSKKARAKTASEKRFAALQTGKAPTNAKGIEALSSAKGLTKAQKKALVKLMQKKLDV